MRGRLYLVFSKSRTAVCVETFHGESTALHCNYYSCKPGAVSKSDHEGDFNRHSWTVRWSMAMGSSSIVKLSTTIYAIFKVRIFLISSRTAFLRCVIFLGTIISSGGPGNHQLPHLFPVTVGQSSCMFVLIIC